MAPFRIRVEVPENSGMETRFWKGLSHSCGCCSQPFLLERNNTSTFLTGTPPVLTTTQWRHLKTRTDTTNRSRSTTGPTRPTSRRLSPLSLTIMPPGVTERRFRASGMSTSARVECASKNPQFCRMNCTLLTSLPTSCLVVLTLSQPAAPNPGVSQKCAFISLVH